MNLPSQTVIYRARLRLFNSKSDSIMKVPLNDEWNFKDQS